MDDLKKSHFPPPSHPNTSTREERLRQGSAAARARVRAKGISLRFIFMAVVFTPLDLKEFPDTSRSGPKERELSIIAAVSVAS